MPSYTQWTWSEPSQRHFCHLLADDGLTILDTLWAGPDNSPAMATAITPSTLPIPANSLNHAGASTITSSFSSSRSVSNIPQHSGAAYTIHNDSSSNPNTTLKLGQHIEIADRNMLPFRHVDKLGMGASAIVEIVVDQTGQQYAHKAFRKYYGRELKRVREEFRNEIEIMKRLCSNPHIIQVFGSYTCGRDLGMLLLPVANGGDLKTFLGDIKDVGFVTINQRDILNRGIGCLASGLAFIHKHTVRHKDIKPSNILVHDGLMIYTDFGISLDASHLDETTTTGYHGAMTERFCAPEVARSEPRNRKSDVFSLACVYIEILIVVLPQVDFGDKIPTPYWQKVDHIQITLTQKPLAGHFASAISGMLEPRSANRIGAEELLNRLQGLRLKFNLFCNTCVSNTSGEPTSGTSDWSGTFKDINEAHSRHKYGPIQSRLLQVAERPLKTIDLVGEYIYIFTSHTCPGMVKIGVTSDVTKRLTDLSRRCKLPFAEYWYNIMSSDGRRRTSNAYRVERLVQTEFLIKGKQQGVYCQGCQSSHVDWFDTSPGHAAEVIGKFAGWMDSRPYVHDSRQNLWVLTKYAKLYDLERICSLTAE